MRLTVLSVQQLAAKIGKKSEAVCAVVAETSVFKEVIEQQKQLGGRLQYLRKNNGLRSGARGRRSHWKSAHGL